LNPSQHGFGSLIRGTGGAKYSFLYNLYAHNRSRNPRPGNYNSNPYYQDPNGLLLDFRNNVIYNWGGEHAGYNQDTISVTKLNYVNNYLITGENSKSVGIAYSTCSSYNRGYFANNYYNQKMPEDQWSLVKFHKKWTDDQIMTYKQNEPFETGFIKYIDAIASYKMVLVNGGASLPKRDKVDVRIVEEVKKRTGKIIKSQKEVGGWPKYRTKEPLKDTDHDGMPDYWEDKNILDNQNPDDRNIIASDGYTMLERYLNSIK